MRQDEADSADEKVHASKPTRHPRAIPDETPSHLQRDLWEAGEEDDQAYSSTHPSTRTKEHNGAATLARANACCAQR